MELLERAAFDGEPFDIGIVYIHSANPARGGRGSAGAGALGLSRTAGARLAARRLLKERQPVK
ncbi:hypothetical protein [Paractinoplanes deccanensis]|uniref:hypothetical protein n=1 Tax=Paractinoplanes deccanensis TaxID=113561 RepID=UPI0036230C77